MKRTRESIDNATSSIRDLEQNSKRDQLIWHKFLERSIYHSWKESLFSYYRCSNFRDRKSFTYETIHVSIFLNVKLNSEYNKYIILYFSFTN